MGVERRERLVEQEHRRLPRNGASERDPLALAARDHAWALPGKMSYSEPLHDLADPRRIPSTKRDVRAHREVREQRVILKDESDRALFRRHVNTRCRVEPAGSIQSHHPALRAQQASDHAQRGGLTGTRRPNDRDRLGRDPQAQLEPVVAAESLRNVDVERRHGGTTLTAIRTAALTTTNSAPIARAVSKSTSNCS